MLISITRLHLRSIRYLPMFLLENFFIFYQLKNTPGLIAGKIVNEGGLGFWTMTAWKEETAMKFFRNSGKHQTAMPKLQQWSDEASLAHLTIPDGPLPSWFQAYDWMKQQGRTSQLKDATIAHQEGRTVALRFKPRGEYIFR